MNTVPSSQENACVKILPQSKGDLIVFEYSGYITEREYMDVLFNYLNEVVEKEKSLRLVCRFCEDYEGWEEGAAQANMKNIIDHVKYVSKIAYVNPPSSKVFQTKLMGGKLFKGEMKYYNSNQFDEAIEWVSQ